MCGAEGMSPVKAEWRPMNYEILFQLWASLFKLPGVQAFPLSTETAKAPNSQHFGGRLAN